MFIRLGHLVVVVRKFLRSIGLFVLSSVSRLFRLRRFGKVLSIRLRFPRSARWSIIVKSGIPLLIPSFTVTRNRCPPLVPLLNALWAQCEVNSKLALGS